MEFGRLAKKTFDGVTRFAKLERVLAFFCLFIPLILIWRDNWTIRESISAYYDMEDAVAYYFPLTVAAMLFIVNGVVKEKKFYNTFLGAMLAGLIIFNKIDAPLLHYPFAVLFFFGNAVVILFFSSKKERWFKAIMVAIIAISMLCWFPFRFYDVFWPEWISFGIIAFHYILESWGVID